MKSTAYTIEILSPADWEEVRSIYLAGIRTGQATFETEAPDWERWDAVHLKECRLVARVETLVAGWAALSPISARRAYAGVAEVSVYVGENFRGLRIGRALLESLVECSERHGLWTLQAGIIAENESSLAIHRRCGFREVGRRERIGQLNGSWRDVILMERRSKVVGAA